MSIKTTLGLLVVALILPATLYWDLRGTPFFSHEELDELVPWTHESITEVELKVPSQPIMRFQKQQGEWWITRPLEFPARDALVRDGICYGLTELRQRGDGGTDASAVGIDDDSINIKLHSHKGIYSFRFGDDHPTRPWVYLEIQENDSTPQIVLVDAEPRDVIREAEVGLLRDDALCEIPYTRANRVAIRGSSGEFELVRNADGWWVEGEFTTEASAERVRSLVTEINAWGIEEFVEDGVVPEDSDPRYGLQEPRIRVEVEGREGSAQLLIGADAPQGNSADPQVYVAWEGKPHVFTASARPVRMLERDAGRYRLDRLFQSPLESVGEIVIEDRQSDAFKRIVLRQVVLDGEVPIWIMQGEEQDRTWPVDDPLVANIIDVMDQMVVSGHSAGEVGTGLSDPRWRITFVPTAGLPKRVSIGDRVGVGNDFTCYLKNESWGWSAQGVFPLLTIFEQLPWSLRSEVAHSYSYNRIQRLRISLPNQPEVIFNRRFDDWNFTQPQPAPSQEKEILADLEVAAQLLSTLQAFSWKRADEGAPGPRSYAMHVQIEENDRAVPQGYWVSPADARGYRWLREQGGEWVMEYRPRKDAPDLFRLLESVYSRSH